jgi:hypothetical protein
MDVQMSMIVGAILILGMLVLGFAYYSYSLDSRRSSNHQPLPVQVSSCPNPDCIRCQKYRQVQQNAKSRLPWIVKELLKEYPNESLDRLHKSIQQRPSLQPRNNSLQAPTVLMVSDLPSFEVVTRCHTEMCRRGPKDDFDRIANDSLILGKFSAYSIKGPGIATFWTCVQTSTALFEE